jgi:hypothetical protein
MGFINSVKGKILIGFILAIIVYVSFRGTAEAVGLWYDSMVARISWYRMDWSFILL